MRAIRKNKGYDDWRFSEVVDSPESLKEFLIINNIKQDQIVCVTVVWKDKIETMKHYIHKSKRRKKLKWTTKTN
jgi:nitrogen regulatory protein PII-like uncharacterized protein